MQSTFSTARLLLVLLTEDEADFILKLVNTKGWIEFIGDRNIHTKEDAINYIMKIINTVDLFYWVVSIKQNNTPIGIISFLKRNYLEYFDIGFAFLPKFNRYGYAFEASKTVLTYLTEQKAYKRILATTIPGNYRSIKLLNKLGFDFEKEIQMQDITMHVFSNNQ